jgi:hypothetical protein
LEKDIQEVEFMNQTPYIRQPFDNKSFEADVLEDEGDDDEEIDSPYWL